MKRFALPFFRTGTTEWHRAALPSERHRVSLESQRDSCVSGPRFAFDRRSAAPTYARGEIQRQYD